MNHNQFISLMFCMLLSFNFVHADFRTNHSEYTYMDKLTMEEDGSSITDKGSRGHNYTEAYSLYFSSLKEKPIKFLEIGIYQGNSVKFWEKYFKNAELHFIDITYENVQYFSKRSHYYLANQENADDLRKLMEVTGGNFDVILDDGGHTMNQQLVSFQTLFPYVKSGGLYIIEDIHTSYWKIYGGGGSLEQPKAGSGTFVDYLKTLIDEVNYVGARTGSASHEKIPDPIKQELNEYRKDIYSIHFYDSLCFIIKR